MSLIENNKSWKDGRYLQNKGEHRYSKMYSAKGHEFTLKIRSHEDNNKLDQKKRTEF